MNTEIKIPTVGESITEVTVSKWLKNEGEYVELDEVICELESEKATFELNAESAGVLHQKAKEGDTLKIGEVICEIDSNATAAKKDASAAKTENKKENTETKPVEKKVSTEAKEVVAMKIPTVGESITEVTIATWLKENGDHVKLDEVIAEIESEKATFELTAEAEGVLEIIVQSGETIAIGTVVCNITVGEGAIETAKPVAESSQKTAESNDKSYAAGHASPAAAKILAEKDVEPTDIKGSGVNGRITKEDAQKAEKQQVASAQSSKQEAQPVQKASPLASGNRGQHREKMTSLRKTVSRRLVAVKNETAMLTTFNEVDMKPIMELRSKYKDAFKEKFEIGLGFMSFFTKAVCVALKEWPAVNAQIDKEEIIYSDFCDVSVAVSTPRGLVVPVIRNAEQMSFAEIEKEIIRLATRARDGKLSIDEMTGGTFTITNGGVFGSMMSTPIINAPQSAILGMHNIVERPVVINGQIVARPMMYVALSYDHRIIDGRESVSFLVRVKQLLEDPARLLLGV